MPRPIDPAVRLTFSRKLRAWYKRNARDLPWRRTRDAYQVLVSELMLQQTQVSRVVDYYGEFLDRFPTLAHVARAKPAAVMEAWEGLGYYARARNLHRLAISVTDGGARTDSQLPAEPEALRALPGIGAYTAGAVASFAYERRAALVDTNVARVLYRIFVGNGDPKAHAMKAHLWEVSRAVLPHRHVFDFNQALMDFGATVCSARKPLCGECPMARGCVTLASAAPPARRRLQAAAGSRDRTR